MAPQAKICEQVPAREQGEDAAVLAPLLIHVLELLAVGVESRFHRGRPGHAADLLDRLPDVLLQKPAPGTRNIGWFWGLGHTAIPRTYSSFLPKIGAQARSENGSTSAFC